MATTMSGILTNVGTLVTASIGWAGQFVTFITSNALIELFVITGFVGLGVGLVMRLIRG